MTTKPSDDEGLKIIRDDKPPARLFQGDLSEADSAPTAEPEQAGFSSVKRIFIVLAVILILAVLAIGVAYWIEAHRYPVVVTIGLPDDAAKGDPLAGRSLPLIPVKPDMLHVTSIALGEPRLTIVNGKRLAEGDWLVVETALGVASVRVTSIEDGLVRFRHGGESIDAKLQPAPQKKPK